MEDTVNDINLNIPARGPKGDPGPKGDVGPKGDDGAQGEAGATWQPYIDEDTKIWHVKLYSGVIDKDGDLGKGPKGDKGDPGPQGPQGVAGKDGHSVWQSIRNYGPNMKQCWFSDLVNASASNPPKVNDIMINADGNMAMIIKVDIANDLSAGGGTFDYGPWVGNIKGPKGNDGKTPVRGTDYWTQADQDAIKQWVKDQLMNEAF